MSKRVQFDADDLEYEVILQAATPKARMERCEITGKICWRKASKAANAAKQMRIDHADPFIESYQCQHCGLWHTGHAPGTPRVRADLMKLK